MKKKLSLNGRFLSRPPTGVDRVARELVRALTKLDTDLQIEVVKPRTDHDSTECDSKAWGCHRVIETETKRLPIRGHLWEQLFLPFWRRETTLLNLCSTGPILRSNQLIMIHDAQVWDVPESYSRAFVWLYRFLIPIICRRSKYVVTVSEYSKARLAHHGVAPLGKISVVHNGVDHMADVNSDQTVIEKYDLENKGYFLALGSQAPHKNIDFLIKIFAQLDPKKFIIVIAGSKNSKVFSDGKDGTDPPNVIRTGRVSDEELKGLYKGATALLFPSTTEGFGLPPLEAMFCKCPVIVSSGGAMPEICGEAAIYVDPTDAIGWNEAIKKMAADQEFREIMSDAGTSRATEFKWSGSAKMLVEVIREREELVTEKKSAGQIQ